jgi:flagellar basal-body rod modification protein FlgD
MIMSPDISGRPLSIFDISGRAMSAQLVRLNTTASNLANAGTVSGSKASAFRALRPVFETAQQSNGIATVGVERIVRSTWSPPSATNPTTRWRTRTATSGSPASIARLSWSRWSRPPANIKTTSGPANRQDLDARHIEAWPMSVIDGLNAPNTAPATSAAFGGQGLDQKAFLRLLTTQLTTQDPFNPVDNTQMVAQMAQFTQVAGIAEMNQTLKSISDSVSGGRLSDASSWIGRSMLVGSEFATPLRDGSYGGELTLPANADRVSVSFVDEAGATVHTMELGARPAGAASFGWDGRNEAGQMAATGPLRVVVTAASGTTPVTPTISTWTAIAGLQSPANGGEARLVTGLGLLKPQDAIRIA